MDGTFPLKRDPDEASPRPNFAAWQREISDVRQGVRSKVSTKAAAHYLGVHYTTLREWVRDGSGPEPVKNPARPGTAALNQHLGFTLESLDAFVQARSGNVITRGRRTDTEAVRRETERVNAAIELKAAEDQLAKARERAKRLGIVCFHTIGDIAEPHPWARIDGLIVGHAWSVEDEDLERAAEDIVESPLLEALSLPWQHATLRAPYAEALQSVLDRASVMLREGQAKQHETDLVDALSSVVLAQPTTCDRCGKPAHTGRRCRL